MINLLNAIAEIINLGVHFIVYIIITAIIILSIIFLALVACRNHRDRNASLDLTNPVQTCLAYQGHTILS